MGELLTYSLADLVPLGAETYARLIARHNAEHRIAIGLGTITGLLLLGLSWRPSALRQRAALGLLAALWLWVAWAFLWQTYAPFNWSMRYAAGAFAVQSLLLLAVAAAPKPRPRTADPRARQAGLLLLALVLLAPLAGGGLGIRGWPGAEHFGSTPDPTVLGSLAVLLTLHHPLRPLLLLIPGAWAFASAVTLYVLDDPSWAVLPLALAGTLALMIGTRARARGLHRGDGGD